MKVVVEIPEGRYCTICQFCQERIHSWGYEESHFWCAYYCRSLTKISDLQPDDIKKCRKCINAMKKEAQS